jgi:hypothetical protein
MNWRGFIVGVIVGWMATWVGAANAATITASAAKDLIEIGEATSMDIVLELDAVSMEEASVFEGRFDFIGFGSVADATLTSVGGPTWTSTAGNIVGTQAIVSLTSSNQGADRLLATLEVTGLAPGIFEIFLGSPTFASFDIDEAPFLQDLNIINATGDMLASVTVVPLPPALVLLVGPALGVLTWSRRREPRGAGRAGAF